MQGALYGDTPCSILVLLSGVSWGAHLDDFNTNQFTAKQQDSNHCPQWNHNRHLHASACHCCCLTLIQ